MDFPLDKLTPFTFRDVRDVAGKNVDPSITRVAKVVYKIPF